MDGDIFDRLVSAERNLFSEKQFSYGTAGFRDKGETLRLVVFRMGILAHLRSLNTRLVVGVVITASHNPVEDNGVKLVDPRGEMLSSEWEGLATELANAPKDQLRQVVDSILSQNPPQDTVGHVFIARDTRPSGEYLTKCLVDALVAMGTEYHDYGVLTTPQLHYLVRNTNLVHPGTPLAVENYYKEISTSFEELVQGALIEEGALNELTVDGANGVGALILKALMKHMKGNNLQVNITYDGTQGGVLNEECGADFVKTRQQPPSGLHLEEGKRYVSFDGDGDRVVYYCLRDGVFCLLDGDRIAALCAGFIKEQLRISSLELSLACVQTAYANGSSSVYLSQQLGVEVSCVPTGVKHLHQKALQYDIGVYFEANGHGTVLFSMKSVAAFQELMDSSNATEEQREAARRLFYSSKLINQAIGDAISDMLIVEAILRLNKWSCIDWSSLYQDLPNRLLKVSVPDRTVFKTTNAERYCTSPVGLQEKINEAVSHFSKARSFVRPSGTEDVVRVYVEAATQEETDKLAEEVVNLVKAFV